MSLFAKRSKKRGWIVVLLIMALLLSAVPMFALDAPTSSTPLPTPSGVTSITIGGVTAGYWQDNNVASCALSALLIPMIRSKWLIGKTVPSLMIT
ncbi:hypothetical protein DesLBE_1851 [Desulfitobacterium sp. LBE]|uniref:hypothetical protein n=1 Tax=Desulfitobacterium sp. LBE TaxID=884086 RepID=UPI00119B6F4F|nr:hypothetical protein [Desulfitobacterium sp. LBE]TWH57567.1 hypothetical protein DesLBE_1851 [Desulfitobacterium sp. LBE]